jgi:hypothetical protein
MFPRCSISGLALLLLASTLSIACADGADDRAAAENPSFDVWCDKHLCDWSTESGAIAQTSTWHKQDLAVSLLDTGTKISQKLKLSSDSAKCILFDTIADVAPLAQVALELDYNNDGIIDDSQQIPALRWTSVPVVLNTPLAYDGLTLSVVKGGNGRAVLAQMRIVPQLDCSGDPLPLKEDSVCSQNEVCVSGRCEGGHCQPCPSGGCPPFTPSASSE